LNEQYWLMPTERFRMNGDDAGGLTDGQQAENHIQQLKSISYV
jgi:hypothetical protein